MEINVKPQPQAMIVLILGEDIFTNLHAINISPSYSKGEGLMDAAVVHASHKTKD